MNLSYEDQARKASVAAGYDAGSRGGEGFMAGYIAALARQAQPHDHRETFEAFFRELWATMVDPLEDAVSFADGMPIILEIARAQREQAQQARCERGDDCRCMKHEQAGCDYYDVRSVAAPQPEPEDAQNELIMAIEDKAGYGYIRVDEVLDLIKNHSTRIMKMNDTPPPTADTNIPTDGWVDIEEAMPGGRYDGIFENSGFALEPLCPHGIEKRYCIKCTKQTA